MGAGASAGYGSELASLGAWHGITSFPVSSDLVVDFNTCLNKPFKACWESDLV